MKRILMAALVALSMSHVAKAANCLSQQEMQEIAQKLPQFSNLANREYCFDGSQTSNLLAAISFMRNTQFSQTMSPSPDELFSGRFANSWWDYFTGRINEFNVQKSCPKGVGAYVYGWGGNTMYVCPLMLSEAFAALDRASVFMHEARHIDGFPHVTCRSGARKSIQGACDSRISDGGSYAVTVETYAQMAKYGNLHPALRAYARAAAVVYADEAFDSSVRVARNPNLLVMTTDKQFHNLQLLANPAMSTLGLSPALGKIVMRSQHLVLIPSDRTLAAKYVFANNEGEISQAPGDAIIEYNTKSPAEKAKWIDLHMATQWNARIYDNSIHFSCSASSEVISDIQLPARAANILYPQGYDRSARVAYLALESGKLMEFGCTEGSQSFLRDSTLKLDQSYKRIHKIGNDVIGLTQDGKLFRLNLASGTSVALTTAVDGQIVEIAPRQSFEFFDAN